MTSILLALLALNPSADLAAGKAALRAKDPDAAKAALQRCVTAAPESVDCHWELGWAHWLSRDWDATVESWEVVERLAPDHPELERYLGEARGQQKLRAELKAEEAAAPTLPPAAAAPGGPAAGALDSPLPMKLRLRAVGDVMLGTDFPAGHLPPEDGARMLTAVEALMRDADLTFINLEGPLCDSGETRKCAKGGNCYAFRTPTRYGKFLKAAGADLASTANNHSGDFGEECRRETEATLDGLGIAWSGPPGSIATADAGGLRVAMIAFHTSGATNNVNDHQTAQALVKRAQRGHDLVIVSFHGGAEGKKALHVPEGGESFYGENRGDLRKFARAVIDAGADLVLGHGPHVPRGMELYQDRLIAYSLGNFATYGRFNLSGPLALGYVLEVELASDGRFEGGRIFSTRQEGKGVPVLDEHGEAAQLIRKLSREDFGERGVRVAKDGRILRPAG
ncbi:MAG: CapA family protein [Deltaproteobacteria bacterium]|nr:CapA family protein [Deltaproteobacteria bacterium]